MVNFNLNVYHFTNIYVESIELLQSITLMEDLFKNEAKEKTWRLL